MDRFIQPILDFLKDIGLIYHLENIKEETFLPGLKLRNGSLVIDLEKLLYPGDILHEAGHLACMPPDIRATMNDNLESNDMHQGGEMMAIVWSYAAALHIGIPSEVVFHEHGYRGGSQNLIENFRAGRYIGLPLLQWCGMSYEPGQAEKAGKKPFPAMISWTCTRNMYTKRDI